MSLSINNNASALVALETLNQTQESLSTAQNAVATGKKVSSAADNPAAYGISSQINNDISGQTAVNDGLSYASQIVSTTLNAADSIVSTLNDVRESVTDYIDHQGDDASLKSINDKLTGLAGTINTIARNATVQGVNLLSMGTSDGYGISSNSLTYLTGAQGDMQTISGGEGLFGESAASAGVLTDALGLTSGSTAGSNGVVSSASGGLLESITASGGLTADNAHALINKISTALSAMTSVTSTLGASKITINSMSSYGQNLSDSLTDASSTLVDADMSAESAKLTALQTKQSLGIKALTIANGQSQNILSLFQ